MSRARRTLLAASCGIAALVWIGWPAPAPNLLLVTVDALRPDHLSCYGGAVRVPVLDRLAREGVLFERVSSGSPWTTPSLATIMTGLDPSEHRLRLPQQALAATATTLANRLQQAGWRTAAVVGAYPADHTTGLALGFQSYEDRYNAPMVYPEIRIPRVPSLRFDDLDAARGYHDRKLLADSYRTDEAVTDAAIGWLKRHAGARFALWVHYFGPHEKRERSLDFGKALERFLRQYPEDVARFDSELGRLLAAVRERGWENQTLVVVLGDHGQSLMEHNYFGHGANLYEPSLRVPWLMRFPSAIEPGQRVVAAAQTVDVLPTLSILLGLPAPGGLRGRNALAREYVPSDAYAETYLSATAAMSTTLPFEGAQVRLGFVHHSLRRGSWKLIQRQPSPLLDTKAPPAVPDGLRVRGGAEELYRLADDPGERSNVIDRHPQIAAQLRARLVSWTAPIDSAGE
jgi:choline-sulfatase